MWPKAVVGHCIFPRLSYSTLARHQLSLKLCNAATSRLVVEVQLLLLISALTVDVLSTLKHSG